MKKLIILLLFALSCSQETPNTNTQTGGGFTIQTDLGKVEQKDVQDTFKGDTISIEIEDDTTEIIEEQDIEETPDVEEETA